MRYKSITNHSPSNMKYKSITFHNDNNKILAIATRHVYISYGKGLLEDNCPVYAWIIAHVIECGYSGCTTVSSPG